MKKKLLVLLIALASTMMPNLVSAITIEIDVEAMHSAGLDPMWADFD